MFNRFYKLQLGLCITLFFLIVLGAGVRIAHAGLSCPDWPLCFGQLVPPFNTQVFLEWFHRLIAGLAGIFILGSLVYIWAKKQMPGSMKRLAVSSLGIFILQAWLGGQTVIQLLKTEIVTAHLIGGYSLFAVNLWILFRLKRPNLIETETPFKKLSVLLLFIVFGQAILGALVSSHYAGLACGREFPGCNGSLLPALNGVVGIHFFHRWNGFIVASIVFMSWIFASMISPTESVKKYLGWAMLLILVQISLGIGMIFSTVHPGFSVLHSLISLSIFTVLLRGVDHVYYR